MAFVFLGVTTGLPGAGFFTHAFSLFECMNKSKTAPPRGKESFLRFSNGNGRKVSVAKTSTFRKVFFLNVWI